MCPLLCTRRLEWAGIGAIGSTAAETPSLTLMLLPRKRRPPPAYEAWLVHPAVRCSMNLPKHGIALDGATAWVTAPAPGMPHPGHDMQLIIIANSTGWGAYCSAQAVTALARGLGAVGCTMTAPAPTHMSWAAPQGAPEFKPPKKLQAMRLPHAPQPDDVRTPLPPAASRQQRRTPASQDTVREVAAAITAGSPPPLRWHAASILYTDGSCLNTEAGQRIGAAVMRPAHTDGTPRRWAVDPCGAGPTNTINRAELAAILCALQVAEQENTELPTPGTIATDSACSLYQIRQQLTTPKNLMLSKHRELLLAITGVIQLLVIKGRRVHLIKVRAHTGVLGNEAADELAKLTALGQVPVDITCHVMQCMQVHAGCAPYHDLYWPALLPSGTNPAPVYLSNLTDALRAAATPGNATGGANIGVYAQLWATTATHMDGAASNHMWTATGVTHAERRSTFQARCGVLYNAKIAARMRQPYAPRPTPATARGLCPLCGAPDSIGHILGGCSHSAMHALYIQRHDQACRLVVKALRMGQLGGYCKHCRHPHTPRHH